MPKEITHWLVAEEAFLSLPEKSNLFKAIKSHPNLYYCSAVLPDTPYYCLTGRCTPIKKATNHLHCQQENGFATLAAITRRPALLNFQAELSLLAGLVTHLIADAVFHPLIFFLCGNDTVKDDSEVTACHRRLETRLDQFYLKKSKPSGGILLEKYLKDLEISDNAFFSIMSFFLGVDKGEVDSLKRAMACHCQCQKFFNDPKMTLIIRLLDLVSFGRLKKISALFYQDKVSNNPFTDSFIRYQNPASGLTVYTNSDRLKRQAVEKILTTFRAFEQVKNRETLHHELKGLQGANMTTGLLAVTSDKMRFFKMNNQTR